RGHHAVSAAVSFACDHSDLRHCRFGERIKQLCAVSDDAAVLLRNSGQKTRNVFESNQRDIEAVAEANEARTFDRRGDIQNARETCTLSRDDSNGAPTESRKPHTNIRRKHLLDFKEVTIVNNQDDNVANVVPLIRRLRNNLVEFLVSAIDRIARLETRRIFEIVRRNKREKLAHDSQRMLV